MDIKILVASHKNYRVPKDLTLYLPIFVGSAFHVSTPSDFARDDLGDNISNKNSRYNELTGLYWGWKHLSSDYIGMVHYRRYFTEPGNKNRDKFERVLSKNDVENYMKKYSIIVPKKRRYFIETIESHYLHSHSEEGLNTLRKVFLNLPKKYSDALDQVLKSRSAHMFNMFIMERKEFRNYCSWLFDILFRVENDLNYKILHGNEERAIGFLSEILLDVWLIANHKSYVELPVCFMEKQHWARKISVFVYNKISRGRRPLNTHIK
ncbi:DUF4422 domain-containing protein [Lacticaseibacillus paracasei]|uniref:DUF4422 domain-containing protein n=1 Tax=Lacticaseibacillus paracasei TaxID=1597 RepID=UPI000CD1BE80|nr:DUF4422 domain-containing protein [Lacticaseibacillus paracasei]MBT9262723.1 DUF4422 domain-containing protein [Lacticaseibacillus paracasei]MDE3280160.1 DUF4422 domain-containing protein [Lacticaseibacillus paracasei]NVO35438.1 DUF4422 domain-containing protein [Lacticaseibacillus paracasei subsp. paracasei]